MVLAMELASVSELTLAVQCSVLCDSPTSALIALSVQSLHERWCWKLWTEELKASRAEMPRDDREQQCRFHSLNRRAKETMTMMMKKRWVTWTERAQLDGQQLHCARCLNWPRVLHQQMVLLVKVANAQMETKEERMDWSHCCYCRIEEAMRRARALHSPPARRVHTAPHQS